MPKHMLSKKDQSRISSVLEQSKKMVSSHPAEKESTSGANSVKK